MKPSIKYLIYITFGALILMIDAFYNGFPIVYSDSSTYIASGFSFEMPMDRPITYSLLLRLFSLNGISLWLVIFFQSLLTSFLIFSITKIFIKKEVYLKYGLLCIMFLALFTGLSWTTSQILADIFTSIALLSSVLLILNEQKKTMNIFLYIVFTLSVATHLSHVLLFVIILISSIFIKMLVFEKSEYKKINFKIATLLVLTIITVLTMGAAVSKSKHVFFMGAMVEHGIAKKFLDENCSNKNYELCKYKDSLPEKGWQFVWEPSSPVYKMGGWQLCKKEFNEIIHETFTTPKYILLHIVASINATKEQLLLFKIGDGNGVFLQNTKLYERVSLLFPNDLRSYQNSKQNQSKLQFTSFLNPLYIIIVAISLLFLFYGIISNKIMANKKAAFTIIMIITAIILNAWDCGTFANAIDRLGCKMIWLIPLLSLLVNGKQIEKKLFQNK